MRRWLPLFLLAVAVFLSNARPVLAGSPVVKAILFYSPTCPHCHKVITEDLPPLIEKHGDQLQIVAVDTSTPGGQSLYQATVARFSIPDSRRGVPMLVIGETVLVGDREIPEQFPRLIEAGLAQGGVDWPDIPGLREALAELSSESADSATSPMENFNRDPVGNALSVLVLVGMIVSLVYVGVRSFSQRARQIYPGGPRVIPFLAVLGAGISGYLAVVEWRGNPAICGPIGDCNAVQASPAATLMGVIPVAWLGVMGYAAILLAWIYGRRGGSRMKNLSAQAILAMAGVGTIYSIYLTFLEPFVIGATCIWCLGSAVIMTLILLAASSPAGSPAPGTRSRSDRGGHAATG